MNGRFQSGRRIDCRIGMAERKENSLYLPVGGLRRKNRLPELDDPVRRRRIILYCIAGAVFLTGLFFVFF